MLITVQLPDGQMVQKDTSEVFRNLNKDKFIRSSQSWLSMAINCEKQSKDIEGIHKTMCLELSEEYFDLAISAENNAFNC